MSGSPWHLIGIVMMEVACPIWNRSVAVVVFIAACTVSGWLHADEVSAAPEKPLPWLMVPLVTSNPKMDTSVGALAGHLTEFDPKSSRSIFGASGVLSRAPRTPYQDGCRRRPVA